MSRRSSLSKSKSIVSRATSIRRGNTLLTNPNVNNNLKPMSPSVTWDMEKKLLQDNSRSFEESGTNRHESAESGETLSPIRKSSLKKEVSWSKENILSAEGKKKERNPPSRLYSADTLPGAPNPNI